MSQSLPPVAERRAHPFITHDMILSIPRALEATLRRLRERSEEVAGRLKDREVVYLTGCGTAYFAAILGARFFPGGKGAPRSSAVEAFELGNYGYPLDGGKAVLGVSHSGITKTTVDALGHARAKGALTVGITHFQARPIAKVVDEVLIAGDGPDRSLCHTKCYVAGALAGALLGLEVASMTSGNRAAGEDLIGALGRLPQTTAGVLRSVERMCEGLAGEHLGKKRLYFLGSGPNLPTALEAALKIKETSFLAAEGMETEEFLHGAWVSLDAECLVFAIAPQGRAHQRSMGLAKAARLVGATVVGLVDKGDEDFATECDEVVELPPGLEAISPFLYILPLYLFAYYSSVKRGFNPDLLRYPDPTYWGARQIIFPPGTH